MKDANEKESKVHSEIDTKFEIEDLDLNTPEKMF